MPQHFSGVERRQHDSTADSFADFLTQKMLKHTTRVSPTHTKSPSHTQSPAHAVANTHSHRHTLSHQHIPVSNTHHQHITDFTHSKHTHSHTSMFSATGSGSQPHSFTLPYTTPLPPTVLHQPQTGGRPGPGDLQDPGDVCRGPHRFLDPGAQPGQRAPQPGQRRRPGLPGAAGRLAIKCWHFERTICLFIVRVFFFELDSSSSLCGRLC